MKKLIFFLCLTAATNCCFAQKITEYKATNGVVYKIGDVVNLGEGSSRKGSFLYLKMGGWGAFFSDGTKIGPAYDHLTVVIKKIKTGVVNGVPKVTFSVGSGTTTNFTLIIDDAIQACEVVPCANPNATNIPGVADELTKLKKLLDEGAITQAEYDAQKKKLLGEL